jgi:hypothetical protein
MAAALLGAVLLLNSCGVPSTLARGVASAVGATTRTVGTAARGVVNTAGKVL